MTTNDYQSPDAASFGMSPEEVKRREEEKKIQWDKIDVQIVYEGRAITLPGEPGRMPIQKAIEALNRRLKDEYQPFKVMELIDAYPHDAAVAFVKAMSNLYGWASPQTIMTFFGPKHPQMLSVRTGFEIDDVMQCPLGAFALPGIEELVTTGFTTDAKDRPVFFVQAEVKKKDRHVVLALVAEARRIVLAESIYKGKPIRLRVTEDGELDLNSPPEFLDVRQATEETILFDDDIMEQINTNILVPIKETAVVKRHGIPLKRTTLLEGPFGTGKTLTARMAARTAELHGWTFILLDKVQGLEVALEFAKRYQPAVVFAEDIDRIASERDDDTQDLILTIDGVVSKDSQVMTILTTNEPEKLHPVILRPGRLDAVISVRAPSAATVQRLIRHYGRDLIDADEELDGAGEVMAGQIPATIRECVERAKLGMIGRGGNQVSDRDLVIAGQTMKNHLELLNRDVTEESPAEKLFSAFQSVVNANEEGRPLGDLIDNLGAAVSGIKKETGETLARTRQVHEGVQKLQQVAKAK